jgi:hypothetical protein
LLFQSIHTSPETSSHPGAPYESKTPRQPLEKTENPPRLQWSLSCTRFTCMIIPMAHFPLYQSEIGCDRQRSVHQCREELRAHGCHSVRGRGGPARSTRAYITDYAPLRFPRKVCSAPPPSHALVQSMPLALNRPNRAQLLWRA